MVEPSKKPSRNPGIEEAIRRAGSQEELARRLGVSHSAVGKWLWRNCPAGRAKQLEEVTGVPRSEIRPDLFK